MQPADLTLATPDGKDHDLAVTGTTRFMGPDGNPINDGLKDPRFKEGTMVMFKAGKWNLSKDAMKALDQIVAPIAGQEAGYLVEIHGFASAEGPETMNVNLSQERSEAVQRYLVSRGASLTRTSIVGLGTDKPIADNATPSGREQNRRAEVRVYTAAAK